MKINFLNEERVLHQPDVHASTHLKFSCLMCVYYGDDSINFEKSLESILLLQDKLPTQLVLVVDGPIPNNLETVVKIFTKQVNSVEIEVIRLVRNVGLAEALNIGLKKCKYDLIARMDADDIAVPNRFALQIEHFVANPQTDVLGGQISEFSDEPTKGKLARYVPKYHNEIVSQIGWRNPLRHPTVMYKKARIESVGGYPNEYPEDYFLWVELLQNGAKFSNLDKVLVHMRTDDAFFNRRGARFLLGELKLLKKLYNYHLISLPLFYLFSVLRIMLRLSPSLIKKFIYLHASRKLYQRD